MECQTTWWPQKICTMNLHEKFVMEIVHKQVCTYKVFSIIFLSLFWKLQILWWLWLTTFTKWKWSKEIYMTINLPPCTHESRLFKFWVLTLWKQIAMTYVSLKAMWWNLFIIIRCNNVSYYSRPPACHRTGLHHQLQKLKTDYKWWVPLPMAIHNHSMCLPSLIQQC